MPTPEERDTMTRPEQAETENLVQERLALAMQVEAARQETEILEALEKRQRARRFGPASPLEKPAPDPQAPPAFDEWALVELMGRQKIAGRVREVTLAGAGYLRVDVPNREGEIRFTRFYSPQAVYAINPVDRQIALGLAANIDAQPVQRYDLKQLTQGSYQGWDTEKDDE